MLEKNPKNVETPKKVFIQTYGCQMNEYDSDKMLEVLRNENYYQTNSHNDADLIILNTCSIREKAENKVFSELGRLSKLKSTNPNLKIGVGGCVAQQEGTNILKRSNCVDFVFGTDNLFELPNLIKKTRNGQKICHTKRSPRQKVRNFIPNYTFQKSKFSGIKSYIAITKGCNNHCAFCVVPLTRGGEVSREPEHIIAEAKKLISNGSREICLLGQNVNSYNANGIDFVGLLTNLDQLNNLERLRFISPHPKDFQLELASAFKKLPSLCEQMHLPLQSGSDRILRRMRRWYNIDTFYKKVDMLRKNVPEATLSTDLIVGFPGETEEEFEMTIEAIRKIRFEWIYSFKYSQRPGTRASEYKEQLTERVKSQRLKKILETQERITREKNEALVGSAQEILVEKKGYQKEKSRSGRTRGNHSVTIINCNAEIGTLLKVKITDIYKNSLIAESLSAKM